MDDEFWDGDEEDEPLEVLSERATPRRRIRKPERKGNVKVADAADARRAVLAEATGRNHPEPDAWREELAQGQSSRASASIESSGHRPSSGFGLA